MTVATATSPSGGLDQTQLAFVNAAGRDIRLLAPAGCGKTKPPSQG